MYVVVKINERKPRLTPVHSIITLNLITVYELQSS